MAVLRPQGASQNICTHPHELSVLVPLILLTSPCYYRGRRWKQDRIILENFVSSDYRSMLTNSSDYRSMLRIQFWIIFDCKAHQLLLWCSAGVRLGLPHPISESFVKLSCLCSFSTDGDPSCSPETLYSHLDQDESCSLLVFVTLLFLPLSFAAPPGFTSSAVLCCLEWHPKPQDKDTSEGFGLKWRWQKREHLNKLPFL